MRKHTIWVIFALIMCVGQVFADDMDTAEPQVENKGFNIKEIQQIGLMDIDRSKVMYHMDDMSYREMLTSFYGNLSSTVKNRIDSRYRWIKVQEMGALEKNENSLILRISVDSLSLFRRKGVFSTASGNHFIQTSTTIYDGTGRKIRSFQKSLSEKSDMATAKQFLNNAVEENAKTIAQQLSYGYATSTGSETPIAIKHSNSEIHAVVDQYGYTISETNEEEERTLPYRNMIVINYGIGFVTSKVLDEENETVKGKVARNLTLQYSFYGPKGVGAGLIFNNYNSKLGDASGKMIYYGVTLSEAQHFDNGWNLDASVGLGYAGMDIDDWGISQDGFGCHTHFGASYMFDSHFGLGFDLSYLWTAFKSPRGWDPIKDGRWGMDHLTLNAGLRYYF